MHIFPFQETFKEPVSPLLATDLSSSLKRSLLGGQEQITLCDSSEFQRVVRKG